MTFFFGRETLRDHENFTVHFSENRKNAFFFIFVAGRRATRPLLALMGKKNDFVMKIFFGREAPPDRQNQTVQKMDKKVLLVQKCFLLHRGVSDTVLRIVFI